MRAFNVSRTKTSITLLRSLRTRFEADEENAISVPSALMLDVMLAPFASCPAQPTLTRSVNPLTRSWTNTSSTSFRSPLTRFRAMRPERDHAAVGADRREVARADPLGPARRDTDPLGCSPPQVAEEDVHGAVRVVGHEIRRRGGERDEAPVRAHGRSEHARVRRRALGADVHELRARARVLRALSGGRRRPLAARLRRDDAREDEVPTASTAAQSGTAARARSGVRQARGARGIRIRKRRFSRSSSHGEHAVLSAGRRRDGTRRRQGRGSTCRCGSSCDRLAAPAGWRSLSTSRSGPCSSRRRSSSSAGRSSPFAPRS